MVRTSAPVLLLLPCLAAALAACTTTRVEPAPAPAPTSTAPPTGTPEEPSPIEGLASDWQVKTLTYLEGRATTWLSSPPNVANIKCAMSCHTTFPYLLARSALASFGKTDAADAARARFEARVTESKAGTAIPMYGKDADAKVKESHGTEAVLNAAALTIDDLARGAALGASTTTAIDTMWAGQRADGGWDWLEFGLEPWETRDDWGTAMAGYVAGSLPPGTSSAQEAGTTKLVGYLQKRLPSMVLHDRVMVLWASSKLATLLQPGQAEEIATALAGKQLEDGGFSLGSWGQGDLAAGGAATSDGYATAFAVLALCHGITDGKKRPEVVKGLGWLARSQAADGSWPGRSVNSSSARAKGFMTDAATAYATLAITSCVK